MDRFRAAVLGDLTFLQEQLTAANVNDAERSGRTVLHSACWGGHSNIVVWLLGLGSVVNARDSFGWTPIHMAAQNGQAHCIQLLLDAGADAKLCDLTGGIALHYASYAYGSAECVALLISAYPAGVCVARHTDGHTPLHFAADGRALGVCRILLDAGSVVDAVSVTNRTPLYLCLSNNYREGAELLLDRGARLELLDKKRYPLCIPEWAVSFVARRNACRS